MTSWNEEQAKKPPMNGFSRQDSYKVKQKDLDSNIFEKTDYSEHIPLSKLNAEEILNKKEQTKKIRNFYGHKVDEEFKRWAPQQEIAQ